MLIWQLSNHRPRWAVSDAATCKHPKTVPANSRRCVCCLGASSVAFLIEKIHLCSFQLRWFLGSKCVKMRIKADFHNRKSLFCDSCWQWDVVRLTSKTSWVTSVHFNWLLGQTVRKIFALIFLIWKMMVWLDFQTFAPIIQLNGCGLSLCRILE